MPKPPQQRTSAPANRLAWIDWMRGLACVLMFQTHGYDSWLGGVARQTTFLQGSQLLGTLPAPMFLFLAGVSFALIVTKLIARNLSAGEITRKMGWRGVEILGFGLLFRLQEYAIAWGWAPGSDLLRVDILNIIGVSMILMALLCGATLKISRSIQRTPPTLIVAAVAAASAVALLTPPLYTTWRPMWLPWYIESYIDGCHNLGAPQSWIFSLFPWSAFAFAGLATGFVLFGEKARAQATKTLALFGVVGIAAIGIAYAFDHSPVHLYATYDYWHTSPNFLLMRVGLLLVITFLSYAWCQWGLATKGFSPLIQLGQTSLLVYWVHLEFVYGRFSIMAKRAQSIPSASVGLLEITVFMLILSMLRTRVDWKKLSQRVSPATST